MVEKGVGRNGVINCLMSELVNLDVSLETINLSDKVSRIVLLH